MEDSDVWTFTAHGDALVVSTFVRVMCIGFALTSDHLTLTV